MKKVLATIITTSLLSASLFGCGSNGGGNTAAESDTAPAPVEQEADAADTTEATGTDATETTSGDIPTDTVATLKLAGPGLFTDVGENGTADLITGDMKPGYKEVIDRWNEIYPNVTIEVETAPWDNWQAYLQTAALSGEVDILLHGASITDTAEPLEPYLEKDPEIVEQMSMLAVRKNDKVTSYKDYVTYGVSIQSAGIMVVIDTQILEDWGVAVPDKSWTLQDMKEIAKSCTGTNPVSGKQTYGISMIKASQTEKNYIWASRAMNNTVFEYADTIKDTKVTFDTEKSREVMDYIADFYQYSNPDYIEGLDLGNAYTADNDLAMVIVENAYDAYNRIKVNGQEDRYMFLQLPAIQGGQYDGISASHMGDFNLAICNTSQQKDLAWQFIKFMATDDFVQKWLVGAKVVPSNVQGTKYLAEVMPEKFYKPIQEVTEGYDPMFSLQANDCYNSIDFGGFSTNIGSNLNEMFLGNMTADEAVADIQAKVDEYLSSLQ